MLFFDRATFSTRKITDEGFLSARAKVGRPGVQEYVKGIDFLDDDLPANLKAKPFGSIIRVLRPEEEVFKPESVKSFEHKPVTVGHPPTKVVDSTNVKKYQVGFSQSVERKEDSLESRILIQDKSTVDIIQKGRDQVSLGYDADVYFESGVHSVFGQYDAVFRNIKGNHIAIVDRARAGDNFRIQDEKTNGVKQMKTRVIDGKSIELSDDGAAVFDEMKAEINAKNVDIKTLKAKVADAETKVDSLKGELDAVKAKAVTDADMQAKVNELVKSRIKLIDAATKVAPDADFTGKSDREIKTAVIKTLGDSKVVVKDEDSDEYVNAVFDTLVATAKPKSKKLGDGLSSEEVLTVDKARQKMMEARAKK